MKWTKEHRKLARDYNGLYGALATIARTYLSPAQLKRVDTMGLSQMEALEMAYENIQQVAKDAIRRKRQLTIPAPKESDDEK